LENVAFINPAGQTVLIVLNTGKQSSIFEVKAGNKLFTAKLNAGAVGSYVW
jgi:glucosylceramidase